MTLFRSADRIVLAIVLSAPLLCACTHDKDSGAPVASARPLSIDGETVSVRQDADADGARQQTLLRIAQDCLAHGFASFAFTSVSAPKPHLPNRPPNAPAEIASTRTFNPPTSSVPDIQPGSILTVQFYHPGDPGSENSLDAGLISANLAQQHS